VQSGGLASIVHLDREPFQPHFRDKMHATRLCVAREKADDPIVNEMISLKSAVGLAGACAAENSNNTGAHTALSEDVVHFAGLHPRRLWTVPTPSEYCTAPHVEPLTFVEQPSWYYRTGDAV
jgi:hypothetical protein